MNSIYVDPDVVEQVSNRLLQLADDIQAHSRYITSQVQYAINMSQPLTYHAAGAGQLLWYAQEEINRFSALSNALNREVHQSAMGLKQIALNGRLNNERISQMSATFSSTLPGTSTSPITTIVSGLNNGWKWINSGPVKQEASELGDLIDVMNEKVDMLTNLSKEEEGILEQLKSLSEDANMLTDLSKEEGILEQLKSLTAELENVGHILGFAGFGLHIIEKGKYDIRDLAGETVGFLVQQYLPVLLASLGPEAVITFLAIQVLVTYTHLEAEEKLAELQKAEQYASGSNLQQIKQTEKQLQTISNNADLSKLFDDIGLLVVDMNVNQGSLLPPVPLFGLHFPLGNMGAVINDGKHILQDVQGLALSVTELHSTIDAANNELNQNLLVTGSSSFASNASPALMNTINNVSSSLIAA